MMWVELKRGEELVFIAAVYMCPEGSTRDNDSANQLLALEADIVHFRKQGRVILMGVMRESAPWTRW